HDIPPVFEGTVEIDETYLGGSWRNKRKAVRAKGAKRGRGTAKQAAFGILCRNGRVWAEIVPNVAPKMARTQRIWPRHPGGYRIIKA
ncbi:unnamed protein product, partial [marine sediment metagenome]